MRLVAHHEARRVTAAWLVPIIKRVGRRRVAGRLVRLLLLSALALTGLGVVTPTVARGASVCLRTARTPQVQSRRTLTADVQGPPLLDAAAGHVFLTNGGGGDVWMFDACSGKLLQTIVLGANIYGGTLDVQRGRLYVGQSGAGPPYTATNVLVLDTHTGKLLQTIAVPRTAQRVYQPMSTAVAESSGRLWVLSMCVASGPAPCPEGVDLYDPSTKQLRQVAEVGQIGCSLMVDDPANRVYVSCIGTIYVLDGRTGALLQRLPQLFQTIPVADQRTGRLYVPNTTTPGAPPRLNQIAVLNGATGAVLWSIAGTAPIVLDSLHNRVIVPCNANSIADICQYDSRTGRLLLKSTTPQHLVVYAVDEADGLLLGLSSLTDKAGILDERTGKVLSTLSLGSMSGALGEGYSLTSAVYDGQTGRVFVLANPASADPTAGLVNMLITLVVPSPH